jgi:hypothetical protein
MSQTTILENPTIEKLDHDLYILANWKGIDYAHKTITKDDMISKLVKMQEIQIYSETKRM